MFLPMTRSTIPRLNRLLNILMGSVGGVFIGHTLFICWHYRRYPGLYAMQSAPWYTAIVVYAWGTAALLALALLFQALINHKLKKG